MAVDKTKDILVGGTLHSIATGNIIAHADEIMDEDYGKKQSEINQELSSRLTEELKDYLPLSGGTLTGNLYIQSDTDAISYNGITFRTSESDDVDRGIKVEPTAFAYKGGMDELLVHSDSTFYLTLQSDGSEASTGNPYGLRFRGNIGDIIWGSDDSRGSRIGAQGFRIAGKSDTDLLHAGGGTTTLKTINNNSLLGTGNIEVPTTESIQDITGSNTYTGANYISKETNLTDAVIQLDEEIKATNDNLALEHANAEATYVKKAGDTMKGDLTVPNIVVTGGNIDGRKLKVSNTGIDVLAPSTGTAYADSFLRVKDPTGENVIFSAFGVFSDSAVVGEGNQMAYVGGEYDSPTLSVFNTSLVGIGKSVGNPPTEKLDVNGNVKATKFIGPLQGNADTATKATQDSNGANIASTYAKLDTTPFAGAETYDGEHPTFTDWLPSQRSYIGTFKGNDSVDDWTTVISVRHRNGDEDGNIYGMYIATELIGDDAISLRWNRQDNGKWKGEKVILDSYNYTNYVPTIDEITTQVTSKLVDSAPETLDTLNELAAALGDDPNFATTIATQIGNKQDTLVSGTNIKTLGGESILGSGNFEVASSSDIQALFN